MTYEEDRTMKKYLMMLAAGLLTVSLGGCAVVTDSSQTDSVEVEEVAEEAEDDTEKNDTEQEETDEPAWYGSWKIIDVKAAAVSALAEEEVEKYKDQTVTYGETTVMVGDTSYEIEGYETMLDVYTQDSMAQDYKADLSDWWNGAGELSFVQVLANDDFFGSVFFATDNEELWIYCDGVFFRAEKAA